MLLTIAVPTFNRLECLRLLVTSVSGQLAQLNAQGVRIELLICDNASSDGTAGYLEGLAPREDLRVIRHASNEGADMNMVHCFRQARGRYLWICGDDDLPVPGALGLVVDCIEREKPGLVYLPASWHDGDLSPFLTHRPEPGVFFPIGAAALSHRANAYITFISSWVVDREAYAGCAGAPDPARYAGTSLVQLEWHLALLISGRKLMTTERRWVMARSGNAGGYSLFDVFITNFTRIIDDKLHAHVALRRFFRDFMLRSYLPGLVWGLRRHTVGAFGKLDHDKLEAKLLSSWPGDRLLRTQLSLIGRLPLSLARVTFVLGWLFARLWLSWLGLSIRTGDRA